MAYGITLADQVFEDLQQICLSVYDSGEMIRVEELMMKQMDHPDVPIHFPYHHFILPGSLLTLAAMEEKVPREDLAGMLSEAVSRAKNVLGGFCGNYGSCGAGVGAGIFMSIYTDTSPMSEQSWQWANELTGICLQNISTIPGPRCCKRTGFLSIQAAVPYINEKLGLHMEVSDKIACKYASRNEDCKKEVCPFYEGDI